MPKKKVAFIINPISGGKSKSNIPELINLHLDKTQYDAQLFYTQSTEHNEALAKQCVDEQYDVVVAVGGDGTINHTAKFVVNSKSIFGIIPLGSGNGLARHLGISMNPIQAIQLINKYVTKQVDTGLVNDDFFINVAGVGFDAHVTDLFAKAPKRGFWQYTKITLSEFAQYRAQHYQLTIDGKQYAEDAFLICIANGSQYGNNAYISPLSNVSDGVFEVTVLKPFHLLQMPKLGAMIFRKNIHQSALVSVFTGRDIKISRTDGSTVNIDGEPITMGNDLHIRIQPNSLTVICHE